MYLRIFFGATSPIVPKYAILRTSRKNLQEDTSLILKNQKE